jgi:hypothetical protein
MSLGPGSTEVTRRLAAVKLRLPGRRDRTEAAPDPAADLSTQLVRPSGKGRPTPKRNEAQGRRPGPPPPPPRTRKEAYKRMREQRGTTRGAARAGAARGDDDHLPARDRGPVRKLVRDVVDARRNAGSFFLIVAGLVLIGNFVPNEQVRSYTVSIWLVFFLLIIADSIVLGRRIKKKVLERFPNQDHRMRGLVWYGISRATMIRRWRFPKPQVPLGAQL